MGDGRFEGPSVPPTGLLRWPGTLVYALFLLLLCQLPAESPRSLFPFGSFVLTNIEALLAAVLIGFLILRLRARRRDGGAPVRPDSRERFLDRLRDPGLWIVLWIAALALSVAAAPDLRGHAGKFTLRCGAIATLFWISRGLHQGEAGPRRLRTTSVCLVAVATLVSLFGILEGLRSQPIERYLTVFRIVPTTVDGNVRLTATFIHANLTGAFLGMLLPLAAMVAATSRGARGIVVAAAPVVILWSLLGTFSRSAIVAGVVCAAAALVLIARAPGPRGVRIRALLLLGLLILVCAGRWTLDAPFRARFGGRPAEAPFAAVYEVPPEVTLAPGQVTRVPVTVRNTGSFPWIVRGVVPTNLSYHVISMKDETTAIFDGARTSLPDVVEEGGAATVQAWLQAPAEVGRFLVAWDLVREKVTWFSWKDVPPGLTRLNVVPQDSIPFARHEVWRDVPAAQLERAAGKIESMKAYITTGRRNLWRIAGTLFAERPVTGWGADTFRLRYARHLGEGDWDPRSHANNAYLEMLATAGILGLAGWLGVLVTLAIAAVTRRARPDAADGGTAALRIGIAAGIAAFALHGLLDSFFGFYGVMGLFWVLAGLADAAASGGRGPLTTGARTGSPAGAPRPPC
jgi:hypothetical protein